MVISCYIPLHPHQYPINSRFSRYWASRSCPSICGHDPLTGPQLRVALYRTPINYRHINPISTRKIPIKSAVIGVIKHFYSSLELGVALDLLDRPLRPASPRFAQWLIPSDLALGQIAIEPSGRWIPEVEAHNLRPSILQWIMVSSCWGDGKVGNLPYESSWGDGKMVNGRGLKLEVAKKKNAKVTAWSWRSGPLRYPIEKWTIAIISH